MPSSIPAQLLKITSELTRLSRSVEEIKQRWEEENIDSREQIDTIQEELRQSKELNEVLQAQNQDLEAQLAQESP
ncbi:hypothetical protein BT96DRAFT_912979, partial [Gymnopus androsaceus JB14]